jgi:methionyl-tRNA formyltransferase
MKTLVITDNEFLLNQFVSIAERLHLEDLTTINYMCSPSNSALIDKGCKPVDVKQSWQTLIANDIDLIISLHCKQLFPKGLVEAIRCINIHPGYNPYNRGWYPQVFSIINKLPLGATIHQIDAQLDHGPIIAQKRVEVTSDDTSLTAYNKILNIELDLIEEHIVQIINNEYQAITPFDEGNINLKRDFNKLLKIDLNEVARVGDVIDRLRALTHGDYNNAYFEDDDGDIVFINLRLTKKQV